MDMSIVLHPAVGLSSMDYQFIPAVGSTRPSTQALFLKNLKLS